MAQQEGTLRTEIKQNRPFASRRQEAALGILKTADELRWRMGQLLKESRLSLEQYNVLRILRGAGPNGLPTLEVADRMIERSPAITRLLDKLEAKGLAKRLRCTRDRRLVYCVITHQGSAALAPLDHAVESLTDRIMTGLDGPELDVLISALDRLRANSR